MFISSRETGLGIGKQNNDRTNECEKFRPGLNSKLITCKLFIRSHLVLYEAIKCVLAQSKLEKSNSPLTPVSLLYSTTTKKTNVIEHPWPRQKEGRIKEGTSDGFKLRRYAANAISRKKASRPGPKSTETPVPDAVKRREIH
jgi:hypothetical protein